jgi:hypothetical protein
MSRARTSNTPDMWLARRAVALIIAHARRRRHEECALLLRRNGDAVPFTLLPDGSHMSPEIEAMSGLHRGVQGS